MEVVVTLIGGLAYSGTLSGLLDSKGLRKWEGRSLKEALSWRNVVTETI